MISIPYIIGVPYGTERTSVSIEPTNSILTVHSVSTSLNSSLATPIKTTLIMSISTSISSEYATTNIKSSSSVLRSTWNSSRYLTTSRHKVTASYESRHKVTSSYGIPIKPTKAASVRSETKVWLFAQRLRNMFKWVTVKPKLCCFYNPSQKYLD